MNGSFGKEIQPVFLKILIFLLRIIFFMFSNRFDVLILKNKKKHHFDVFLNAKHFEPQPQFQTDPKMMYLIMWFNLFFKVFSRFFLF